MRPRAPGSSLAPSARSRRRAAHGVEDRAAGVEVHRVAELVRLGRAVRLDAGREVARVVAAEAALAQRPEEIPQRPVSKEVQRLVGDLELGRGGVLALAGAGALRVAPRLLHLEVGAAGHVALLLETLDEILDQLLETPTVPAILHQLVDRLLRQQVAVHQRVEDCIVQRLDGLVAVGPRREPRATEPAGQQEVRQLRQQVLEIDAFEVFAGVLAVPVSHSKPGGRRRAEGGTMARYRPPPAAHRLLR